MAINNFPSLSNAFTLFSWEDYPDSRSALKAGGLTSEFKKECWNAIVQKLNSVLTESGLSWNDKYASLSGTQITAKYGALTAKKFNSVLYNINQALGIEFHYSWWWDSSVRGYVGRSFFNGYSEVGKACDTVYHEYFLELVEYLNYLIELLRDEKGATSVNADVLSGSNHFADMLSEKSIPMGIQYISGIEKSVPGIEADHPSAPIATDTDFVDRIKHSTVIDRLLSAPMRTDKECISRTQTKQVIPQLLRAARMVPNDVIIPVVTQVELIPTLYIDLSEDAPVTEISKVQDDTQVSVLPSTPIKAESKSETETYSDVIADIAERLYPSAYIAYSTSSVNPTVDILAKQINARRRSKIRYRSILTKLEEETLVGEQNCTTVAFCGIGTAWLPPIWVNDGLHIRQVHDDPTVNELGELVIT